MKVIAKRAFVDTIDGVKYRPEVGETIDMPAGADWIQAGLVDQVKTSGTKQTRSKKVDDGS